MPDTDTLLQEKLSALEAGQSLDAVLSDLPAEERSEIEALLRLASAVRSTPHPRPMAEQVTNRRAQIMAAADPHTRPVKPQAAERKRPRWSWWGTSLAFSTVGAMGLCLGLALIVSMGLFFSGRGRASARLEGVRGQVQVAANAQSDSWKNVTEGYQVRAGQRLRTLGASEVNLVFYEGTRTMVGANADLVFARLAASGKDGLQVELTQTQGQTSHQVVPLKGSDSFFRVITPAGQANVHGTRFQVNVAENGQARFAVNTGEVWVQNAATEVTLLPGQTTSTEPGEPPAAPSYQFSAQGSLLDNEGSTWTVSGVTFDIDEQTELGPNLDLSAFVQVTGRVLATGARAADRVTVTTGPAQTTTFTGILESMQGDTWMVSTTPIVVNADTQVEAGLQMGTPVEVTANILNDGNWLALKIEALEEDPNAQTPTVTVTPNTAAMPSLAFEPDELLANSCGSTSFSLSGVLRNTGDAGKDYAANVQLGYLIERGGEFVESVALAPEGWASIDGQQSVAYTVNITLTSAWQTMDAGEVKLRVFVAAEANRPDHHRGRATVTIAAGCQATPTITGGTATTPTVTGTLPALTATAAPLPPEAGACTGAQPHPTGLTLAQRYGVSYEAIMYWFCQHYGFGEIDLAYSLSRQSGLPVVQVFELRASGMGWGEIKKQLAPDQDEDEEDEDDQDDKKDKDNDHNGNDKSSKKTPKPPKKDN